LSIDLTISVSADDPSDQKKADEHLLLLLGINRLPVEPFECRDEASNCVIKEVRQRLEKFWYRPVDEEVSDDENRNLNHFEGIFDKERPEVVLPWRGPGGTFQLPIATLLDLPSQYAEFQVLLRPTLSSPLEREYLTRAAADAGRIGKQLQGKDLPASVDAASQLAVQLYIASFRRTFNPFLIAVRCLSESEEGAATLAAAIEAVTSERPLIAVDEGISSLPSGADVVRVDSYTLPPNCWYQAKGLERLPYLADASGAATVFRLPVSVQGGIPGIETRQLSPDFEPGPSSSERKTRQVTLGLLESGREIAIPVDDLTKHTLVTGFTGSGKTVTVQFLLHQLWCSYKIPFLVLESAKQEYRGFIGVQGLKESIKIYTLGNENGVPFRLNPFELLAGVRVESHISRLQVCFEGAIPPIGPSSSIIAEALYRVYHKFDWGLSDVCDISSSTSKQGQRKCFPTMKDFVSEVENVVRHRKYGPEVESNIRAAIIGRITPLLIGSKGRMFAGTGHLPTGVQNFNELLNSPTILELNDLNTDDKALMVMFILTFLREYREQEQGSNDTMGKLKHVTVVEEAHNVLAEVASKGQPDGGGADTRFKAVESFCQLLTEIRALGEGLIIADQSPEKLARDAIRNTNLQIAHQLRDSFDREAIARAMIMTPEQRDYLGKLGLGRAAIFRTGLERATFVQVPPYYEFKENFSMPKMGEISGKGKGFLVQCSDGDVREHMNLPRECKPRPFDGCENCADPCNHRSIVYPLAGNLPFGKNLEIKGREKVKVWLGELKEAINKKDAVVHAVIKERIWRLALGLSKDAGESTTIDREWCCIVHLLGWLQRCDLGVTIPPPDQNMRKEFSEFRERNVAFSKSNQR
jgi:hypothetical protein